MKAVIFDFNGTLLFDTPLHAAAWDRWSTLRCGRPLPPEEYRDVLAGKDNRTTLEYLLQRPVTPEEAAQRTREKEQFYFSLCQDDPAYTLAPGAEAFLTALRQRGIPYAIATSAGPYNMDFYFRTLGLDRFFDRETQVICADGTLPSKPHPAIYHRAMEVLHVQPRDCLIFEDLPTGIASAVAAGAAAVVAVASAQKPEILQALPGVSGVIPDFTAVAPWLSQLETATK